MKTRLSSLLVSLLFAGLATPTLAAAAPHNVILFVADGLRAMAVNSETAPTMLQVSKSGVWFQNSHSLYPTLTMPNSSAIATGHYLGDTGVFANTVYTGFPVPSANNSVTPFLENDSVLGDIDEHFGGNFLDEEALIAAAAKAGYNTAAIGKLGPIGIQSVTQRNTQHTIVIDDHTGHKGGIPLQSEIQDALQQAGLPTETPSRGENGKSGNATTPGTLEANVGQQQYFSDATTKVVLPRLKEEGKPFVLVFWSRDPDGTQHNQGDSLNKLVPGINGPTSRAAIKNADNNLAAIRSALKQLGLADSTNIFITADHGFSTISKQSKASIAAKQSYQDVPAGELPPGFLAIDLAHGLNKPLFDPDSHNEPVFYLTGKHSKQGSGLLGTNPEKPDVVVAASGGSDLIYLQQDNARELAPKVVKTLLAQDYVSGVFVNDDLGSIPGTLPMSSINLKGSAITPKPAMVVNFKSVSIGCKTETLCAAEIADTGLQQGQGMHGSFSRADTYNFMAAIGPDFKSGFVDTAPSSNADVGKTLAHILQLDIPAKGELQGRVLNEAFTGGKLPKVVHKLLRSKPAANHLQTVLNYQLVGSTRYFDAAGFAGRTVGLKAGNK